MLGQQIARVVQELQHLDTSVSQGARVAAAGSTSEGARTELAGFRQNVGSLAKKVERLTAGLSYGEPEGPVGTSASSSSAPPPYESMGRASFTPSFQGRRRPCDGGTNLQSTEQQHASVPVPSVPRLQPPQQNWFDMVSLAHPGSPNFDGVTSGRLPTQVAPLAHRRGAQFSEVPHQGRLPSSRHHPRPPQLADCMQAVDNLLLTVIRQHTCMDACDRALEQMREEAETVMRGTGPPPQDLASEQATSQDDPSVTLASVQEELGAFLQKLDDCEKLSQTHSDELRRITDIVGVIVKLQSQPADHVDADGHTGQLSAGPGPPATPLRAVPDSRTHAHHEGPGPYAQTHAQTSAPQRTLAAALQSVAWQETTPGRAAPSEAPQPRPQTTPPEPEFTSLRHNGPSWSLGSSMHPSQCTPCNFFCFSNRGCHRGVSCTYCHQTHISKAKTRRESAGDTFREARCL